MFEVADASAGTVFKDVKRSILPRMFCLYSMPLCYEEVRVLASGTFSSTSVIIATTGTKLSCRVGSVVKTLVRALHKVFLCWNIQVGDLHLTPPLQTSKHSTFLLEFVIVFWHVRWQTVIQTFRRDEGRFSDAALWDVLRHMCVYALD